MSSEGKKRCPSCGGSDTRHSVRNGLLDAFMQMFHKRPFRCRSCRRRFYGTDEDAPPPDAEDQDDAADHHAG